MRKFINKVRWETRLFSYAKLSEFHLNLVNDKSSHYKGVKSAARHLQEMKNPNTFKRDLSIVQINTKMISKDSQRGLGCHTIKCFKT